MKGHLTALAVVSIAAGIVLQVAASATRPVALVLHLHDLPRGFALDNGHVVSNDELAQTASNTKDYRKLGRLTGYDASYSMLAVSGLSEVDAFASVYKTGSGAHQSMLLTVSDARTHDGSTVERPPITDMPGDEALVYRTTSSNGNIKVDRYTVAWRHGAIFAEVIGGGRSGTIEPADVVALAKKQEARIELVLRTA